MDDYLALSLLIMGIAIGALLIIWGLMSLYFHIRNKRKRRATEERVRAREAAEKARREAEEASDKTD